MKHVGVGGLHAGMGAPLLACSWQRAVELLWRQCMLDAYLFAIMQDDAVDVVAVAMQHGTGKA